MFESQESNEYASFLDSKGQAKISAAVRLARNRIEYGDAVAAWVSGSLVAQLGNQRSDVDLFLVTNTPRPIEQVIEGDVRIDIEYRTPNQVESVIDGLSASASEKVLDGFGHVPSLAGLDDAARLYYALDLTPPSSSGSYVSTMRQNGTLLRHCRLLRSASICASKNEDIQGALESKEYRQLLEISERFLLEASEAYLAGCGEYYVGHKWIFAKLARTPGHQVVLQRLDSLLYNIDLSAAIDVAIRRVTFGQQLLAAAFSIGWHSPEAFKWAEALHRQTEEPTMRTHPEWIPLRIKDRILLEGFNKSSHVQIMPQGLLLWLLASSLPEDSAYPSFVKMNSYLQGGQVSEKEFNSYRDAMLDKKLLISR